MTHMHIPDFVLPVWLWVSGFVAMAIALGISLLRLRSMDKKKKIPLLGAISAAMIVAMSLEILPIAYHINLSVVAGILLGPALGFVAAFIVNLMLALMGHGGVSVIGLNTILLGLEAVLGHTFFSLLKSVLPVFWRAAAATVLTFVSTTLLLIGIVAASNVDPLMFLHGDEHLLGRSAGGGGDIEIRGPCAVVRRDRMDHRGCDHGRRGEVYLAGQARSPEPQASRRPGPGAGNDQ